MERSESHLEIRTLAFPGRWMADSELHRLRGELCGLSRECLGDIPDYGVYLPSRQPYRDRIITTIRSQADHRLIAFSAMLHWQVQLHEVRRAQPVIHLGLVLVAPEFRGRKLMYALYHRPLVRYLLRRLLRPFWITSTTMEPVIVGSVSDGFSGVYPHYAHRSALPTPAHRQIATSFFRQHGHEIGVWQGAWLDEDHFVIRDSSLGACRTLMLRFEDAARYRVEACNEFCRTMLDYSRGDEILQVGRLDMAAVWRSSWWMVQQVKRRLAQPARSHRRNRIE